MWFCFVSFVSFVLVGCVCVFCFASFVLIWSVCVCFGWVCFLYVVLFWFGVCVFCFASFVLIWSVCVFWLGLLSVRRFVLFGAGWSVCVLCVVCLVVFLFSVLWVGLVSLPCFWLVPVWCGVWGGQVLRKPCFQVWPLEKLALTTVTTCFSQSN